MDNFFSSLRAKLDSINEDGEALQDAVDTVTLDIPLLIRLLEYSREDAQTDMDLHNVSERLIELSKVKGTLSMEDYASIVQKEIEDHSNEEQ